MRVVTPTVDGDVLAVLAGADTRFTAAQLARMTTGRSVSGVRRAVLRLVEQGIVLRESIAGTDIYSLNRQHVSADAVLMLAGARSRFLALMRETIGSWIAAPEFAALFGSAARGDMRPGSDIDVFLVHRNDPASLFLTRWDEQVADLALRATSWTGNEVRPLEMSHREVSTGVAENDPLLSEIESEGVVLCGQHHTFWRRMRSGG